MVNFRKQPAWKQITLAHEAGVTERTVQRIERGEKADDETLRRIATALRPTETAFYRISLRSNGGRSDRDCSESTGGHSGCGYSGVVTSPRFRRRSFRARSCNR